MTASKDQTSLTFYRLLRACQIAEKRFRTAAEKVSDSGTKRLLTLYSQQRIRFAMELKQEFANVEEMAPQPQEYYEGDLDLTSTTNVLEMCAESDQRSLQEYERALQEPIPRKAHFLIASQYALMQHVYWRISKMSSNKMEKQPPRMELERSLA